MSRTGSRSASVNLSSSSRSSIQSIHEPSPGKPVDAVVTKQTPPRVAPRPAETEEPEEHIIAGRFQGIGSKVLGMNRLRDATAAVEPEAPDEKIIAGRFQGLGSKVIGTNRLRNAAPADIAEAVPNAGSASHSNASQSNATSSKVSSVQSAASSARAAGHPKSEAVSGSYDDDFESSKTSSGTSLARSSAKSSAKLSAKSSAKPSAKSSAMSSGGYDDDDFEQEDAEEDYDDDDFEVEDGNDASENPSSSSSPSLSASLSHQLSRGSGLQTAGPASAPSQAPERRVEERVIPLPQEPPDAYSIAVQADLPLTRGVQCDVMMLEAAMAMPPPGPFALPSSLAAATAQLAISSFPCGAAGGLAPRQFWQGMGAPTLSVYPRASLYSGFAPGYSAGYGQLPGPVYAPPHVVPTYWHPAQPNPNYAPWLPTVY